MIGSASAMALFVELWANDELDGEARERARVRLTRCRLAPLSFAVDFEAFSEYQADDVIVVDHHDAGWGTVRTVGQQ